MLFKKTKDTWLLSLQIIWMIILSASLVSFQMTQIAQECSSDGQAGWMG